MNTNQTLDIEQMSKPRYYFDTSGLVSFYEKRIDLFEKILESLDNLDVFASEIVMEELTDKYQKHIKNKELSDGLNISKKSMNDQIREIENFANTLNFYNIEHGLEKFITEIKGIDFNVLDDVNNIVAKKCKDSNRKRGELFSNSKFPVNEIKISLKEKMSLLKEAEMRMHYKIPPGYEDNSKEGIERFNDFFIWKSIIKHSKENVEIQEIYFITDDKKDCNNSNDKKILEKEFFDEVGKSIKIISSKEFLEHIGYDRINIEEYKNEVENCIEKYFDYNYLTNVLYNSSKYDIDNVQQYVDIESATQDSLSTYKFKCKCIQKILPLKNEENINEKRRISIGCYVYVDINNKKTDVEVINVDIDDKLILGVDEESDIADENVEYLANNFLMFLENAASQMETINKIHKLI